MTLLIHFKAKTKDFYEDLLTQDETLDQNQRF